MRILVTNDDGLNGAGLEVLEHIAAQLSDDVWTVAPETDQSGASHSLTLSDPLRMRALDERRYAVRGTPTDCVIMGIRHILQSPPDLVLSGVNRGQNIADDVTYSGTIAGAMEGAVLGVRSFALSQAYGFETRSDIQWDTARRHGPALIEQLLTLAIPADRLININFPDCAPDEVKGTRVTVQGKRDQSIFGIDTRMDGRGNPYYWLAIDRRKSSPREGTDLWAIYEGYISVTPLLMDLTDSQYAVQLRKLLE
jgi:5'-nucleotidase